MKKLLLIDGHSLLHRAFHALPEFVSPDGKPVGAVYGFARMLLSALKQRTPDSVIVTWDTPKATFRHHLYVEYKMHRPKTDESLKEQIALAQELVKEFGIEQFFVEGYEADDIIATVANAYLALHDNEGKVEILTSDMDMLQLVNDSIQVAAVKKGMSDIEIMGPKEVHEKYTLAPTKLPDLKGLMGDSSDNIPGVKGIGIKTATALLTQYGSIEGVYEHLDEIKGKTKELLSHQHEMALLSRNLATIRADVPISIVQTKEYTYAIDVPDVLDIFQRHGFKSLVPLLKFFQTQPAASRTESDTQWKVVEDDVAGFVRELGTTVDCYMQLLSDNHVAAWVTPEAGLWILNISKNFSAETKRELQSLLHAKEIIAFDIKTLMHVFADHDLSIDSYYDLMVASAMISGKSMKNIQEALFTHLGFSHELDKKELTATDMPFVMPQITKLHQFLNENLQQDETTATLIETIEMPLVAVLFEMERHGVLLDKVKLSKIHTELLEKQQVLEKEIYTDIGHEINLNSPKQLETVLFDELRLPVVKKTKTQRSTNEAVLTQLAHAHPAVKKILDYRVVSKLTSTYTQKLSEMADTKSRIHTTYNQLKVVTARLSSESPNLQNIPRDRDIAIRSAFVAPTGHRLLVLDYSQIELRILAHLSKDEHLIASFSAGQDIHAVTAAKLFNTFVDEISDRQRQIAKTTNFAVMYGMGPHALSESLGIEYIEAKTYIDDFFEFYPDVMRWRDETITFAKQNHYVQTLWGRRIPIVEIASPSKQVQAMGVRMATNYPNQGTQADLIKKAMVEIDRYFKEINMQDAHMLMQVHDELVFELPESEVTGIAPRIRSIMEKAIVLDVPVVVDCKIGDNWQETKKI